MLSKIKWHFFESYQDSVFRKNLLFYCFENIYWLDVLDLIRYVVGFCMRLVRSKETLFDFHRAKRSRSVFLQAKFFFEIWIFARLQMKNKDFPFLKLKFNASYPTRISRVVSCHFKWNYANRYLKLWNFKCRYWQISALQWESLLMPNVE